jgi:hypothetical protein
MVLKHKADSLDFAAAPTPLLDAEIAEEPKETATKDKPERVIGTDGKSYPAKKDPADDRPQMTDACDEQAAAQAVMEAVYALPTSLMVIAEGLELAIIQVDSGRAIRRFPMDRGTDWQNYPIRPFFKCSSGDLKILMENDIYTVGGLSELVQGKKTLPKFGKKTLENLKQQFENFWMAHPELCEQ